MPQLQKIIRQLRLNRFAGRSGLWTILISFVVIGFFTYSLRRDWKTILTFDWQINIENLLIAALLHSLAIGSMFLAWQYMIRLFVKKSSWKTNFRIYSISLLARRIPLPIWYVGSRVYFYNSLNISSRLILTITALEFALIAITGGLCYVLLLPWYTYSSSWPWWPLLILVGGFFLVIIIRPNLMIELINRILKFLHKQTIPTIVSRGNLLLWSFFYLATWFIDGLGLYFTIAGLISTPPPVASAIGVSTISALVALASTALPGGFGLKELTMGALLSIWMPISAGLVISIFYRLTQTIIETFWAFIGQRIDPTTTLGTPGSLE